MADNTNNIDNQEYIISQYSNSPTIKSILDYFSIDIATDKDIASFLQNIMDIDTANGVGLDVYPEQHRFMTERVLP